MKPVTLIIGYGEVGAGLARILEQKYDVYFVDPQRGFRYELKNPVSVMHVCFPYSSKFIQYVKEYQKLYKPRHTIIHSSVPVGTSQKLMCHHSPIRGIHPYLAEGIKTFIKYLAPANEELANYFRSVGISVQLVDHPNTTEALKLWDTTQYGWNIILEKVIHDWCEKNKVDFNIVYGDANRTYNIGYATLGHPEYKKYILKHKPGPIGGHCVIQNLELFDSPLNDIIRKFSN